MACRSFKSCCLTACCAQVQADDVENKAAVSTTGDGEVKSQVTVHPSQSESDDKVQEERKSTRLRAGSPWWVTRSNTNGRLFWVNEQTKEATWRQPTPPMSPLPADLLVGHSMREWAQVVTGPNFYGAPSEEGNPRARTGICGRAPDVEPLRLTAVQLSDEHALYPPDFLHAIGLKFYLLCEDLAYNGQRRRDVPDLASGVLYIDVGDRSVRRKRHSFHHELWHMVDFHLRGNAFEASDFEWAVFNPKGFKYGHGGKHMRSDAMSSQLSSSPSPEFLNRYCTSSVCEDKAEIWASLMCYQHILNSSALQGKARLLKQRVAQICPQMNDKWWEHVRQEQLKHTDHWEPQYAENGEVVWVDWLTGEKRESKPSPIQMRLTPTGADLQLDGTAMDCDD